MSNYTFREANLEDLSLILKWTEELMKHESLSKNLELPLVKNVSQLVEQWLQNLITDNNSLIIIAMEEPLSIPKGVIIGYMQLQPNEFTVFNMHGIIQMVWVAKNHRQKGLAKQLVKHMEDTFKNVEIPYCEIQYSDSNEEAKAFWKKLGYQAVSHNCRKFL